MVCFHRVSMRPMLKLVGVKGFEPSTSRTRTMKPLANIEGCMVSFLHEF